MAELSSSRTSLSFAQVAAETLLKINNEAITRYDAWSGEESDYSYDSSDDDGRCTSSSSGSSSYDSDSDELWEELNAVAVSDDSDSEPEEQQEPESNSSGNEVTDESLDAAIAAKILAAAIENSVVADENVPCVSAGSGEEEGENICGEDADSEGTGEGLAEIICGEVDDAANEGALSSDGLDSQENADDEELRSSGLFSLLSDAVIGCLLEYLAPCPRRWQDAFSPSSPLTQRAMTQGFAAAARLRAVSRFLRRSVDEGGLLQLALPEHRLSRAIRRVACLRSMPPLTVKRRPATGGIVYYTQSDDDDDSDDNDDDDDDDDKSDSDDEHSNNSDNNDESTDGSDDDEWHCDRRRQLRDGLAPSMGPSLRALLLAHSDVGDATLAKIVLPNCPNLAALCVAHCERVSDATLVAISKSPCRAALRGECD